MGRPSESNPTSFHGARFGDGNMYCALPMALVEDSRLSPVAVGVAAMLYANSEGWCTSPNQLAKAHGGTRKKYMAAFSDLVDARWMAREALGANRYRIHLSRQEPFCAGEWQRLNTVAETATAESAISPMAEPAIAGMAESATETSTYTSTSPVHEDPSPSEVLKAAAAAARANGAHEVRAAADEIDPWPDVVSAVREAASPRRSQAR